MNSTPSDAGTVSVSGLAGGLTVVTRTMPHMESVSLGLWVGAGSRYENSRNNGISHFLEHLLFKGTGKRSQKQITRAIEGVGGSLNGFTAEEYTCYLAKVGSRHWMRALDVLIDMYLDPALKPGDIEKEKGVILQEINMYRDIPGQYVNELLGTILWPDQPLGFMIIGSPESVNRLGKDDFLSYMRKAYVWKNTVLAVAGKIKHSDVVREAGRYVKADAKSRRINALRAKTLYRSPRLEVVGRKTEQTHLAMGVRAFGRSHPDRYVLKLLSVILGGNMSSRLFQQIREKHSLAYAIGTSVSLFRDAGSMNLSAGLRNGKTNRSLVLVVRELRRLKEQCVGARELNRAKEFCVMQLLLSLEKTMNSMLWVGESMLCLGRVRSTGEIIDDIKTITPGDIRRVARLVFRPERLALAAIGPDIEERELEETVRKV